MGKMTLGAFLGANQSFEQFGAGDGLPRYWQSSGFEQSSFFPSTQAHSSAQGLVCQVYSTGQPQPALYFDFAPDGPAAFYSQVATHALRATFWHQLAQPHSGGIAAFWQGATPQPLAASSAWMSARVEGWSADAPAQLCLSWRRGGDMAQTFSWFLDDVLAEADWMALRPDWAMATESRAYVQWRRSGNGALQPLPADGHLRLTVPLNGLTLLQSGLLNHWWEGGRPLVLFLDDDDPETACLCRLANERQPVSRRVAGTSLWQGTLELEGLNRGSLALES